MIITTIAYPELGSVDIIGTVHGRTRSSWKGMVEEIRIEKAAVIIRHHAEIQIRKGVVLSTFSAQVPVDTIDFQSGCETRESKARCLIMCGRSSASN